MRRQRQYAVGWKLQPLHYHSWELGKPILSLKLRVHSDHVYHSLAFEYVWKKTSLYAVRRKDIYSLKHWPVQQKCVNVSSTRIRFTCSITSFWEAKSGRDLSWVTAFYAMKVLMSQWLLWICCTQWLGGNMKCKTGLEVFCSQISLSGT